MIRAYEETVDFIAAGTTLRTVAHFEPSQETKDRVADLIQREKTTGLDRDEALELDQYLRMEHMMRLAKARVRSHFAPESKLFRILVFAAIAFVVGAGSFAQTPIDDAVTPPILHGRSAEHDHLLRFVSIPSKALPEGVQLVERVQTAPLVPLARNPAVLVDPETINDVAVFFGIQDKAALQSVRAGVVAVYQERDPSREIGVYGLWFSDRNAADDRFKKLKAHSEGSPFFLKDDLLLYVWRDDGVSDKAFTAIRDSIKAAEFKRVRRS